jgi:hypothetical protein
MPKPLAMCFAVLGASSGSCATAVCTIARFSSQTCTTRPIRLEKRRAGHSLRKLFRDLVAFCHRNRRVATRLGSGPALQLTELSRSTQVSLPRLELFLVDLPARVALAEYLKSYVRLRREAVSSKPSHANHDASSNYPPEHEHHEHHGDPPDAPEPPHRMMHALSPLVCSLLRPHGMLDNHHERHHERHDCCKYTHEPHSLHISPSRPDPPRYFTTTVPVWPSPASRPSLNYRLAPTRQAPAGYTMGHAMLGG